MNDKHWEKWAALGGVAFVVLNIAASIAQTAPPSAGDSNEEILAWFADHETGLKVAGFLGALSIVALLWWFGSLWRRMVAAEDGSPRLAIVSLIGLAGSGALFAGSVALGSTGAFHADDLTPDTARLLYLLVFTTLSISGAFVASHVLAASALSMRTGFLPKWLGIIGAVSGTLFLGSTLGTSTDSDAIALLGFAGYIVWMVWILGVSAHLWRTADAD